MWPRCLSSCSEHPALQAPAEARCLGECGPLAHPPQPHHSSADEDRTPHCRLIACCPDAAAGTPHPGHDPHGQRPRERRGSAKDHCHHRPPGRLAPGPCGVRVRAETGVGDVGTDHPTASAGSARKDSGSGRGHLHAERAAHEPAHGLLLHLLGILRRVWRPRQGNHRHHPPGTGRRVRHASRVAAARRLDAEVEDGHVPPRRHPGGPRRPAGPGCRHGGKSGRRTSSASASKVQRRPARRSASSI